MPKRVYGFKFRRDIARRRTPGYTAWGREMAVAILAAILSWLTLRYLGYEGADTELIVGASAVGAVLLFPPIMYVISFCTAKAFWLEEKVDEYEKVLSGFGIGNIPCLVAINGPLRVRNIRGEERAVCKIMLSPKRGAALNIYYRLIVPFKGPSQYGQKCHVFNAMKTAEDLDEPLPYNSLNVTGDTELGIPFPLDMRRTDMSTNDLDFEKALLWVEERSGETPVALVIPTNQSCQIDGERLNEVKYD